MADRLTPVQLRILNQMIPGQWHDAYELCRQRRTRMKLTNNGYTEPQRSGPITCFWMIRLTDKGLAARKPRP